MVRINIIDPRYLLDQHLLAEWNEIQMLLGYVQKYPELEGIPETYKLGKGHIKFFKDKILYLYCRLKQIKDEAESRGSVLKDIDSVIRNYVIPHENINDWKPTVEDKEVIVERLLDKHAQKPEWYTWWGASYTPTSYEIILRRALTVGENKEMTHGQTC